MCEPPTLVRKRRQILIMSKRYAHLAPALLRLALGVIFIAHGLPKFQHTAGVAEFFGSLGIPAPAVMVIVVGTVEVVGGALLLIGVATRIAALLLAAVMLGAIVTVKFSMGFVDGYELDLLLLAGVLSVALSGPGSFITKDA